MIRPISVSIAVLAACALDQVASAADVAATRQAQPETGAEQRMPADDAAFVRQALLDGRREVESSREAMTRTRHEEVRSTAQMLMTEQMTLNAELETLAARKGWSLELPSESSRPASRPATEGEHDALDRDYVETQIREHERSLEMFRRQSTSARDADVRELAGSAVPKLEQHLAALRKLRGSPPVART
jgi:putative membrane protein